MKHPHCNRSSVAHAFWCRGFAPLFFIVATALIVVAIGSGIYFTNKKGVSENTPPYPTLAQPVDVIATSTNSATTTGIVTQTTTQSAVVEKKVAPQAPLLVDCGSSDTTADCLSDRLRTCLPAKGVITDTGSGMQIKRVIDGYKDGNCSYRSTIIDASGMYAVTKGLTFDCMIPKKLITVDVQAAGSMVASDMLTYCTGTFIDLMREQMGSTQ